MTQLAIMSVSGCSLLPLAVDVIRKEAFLSHTTPAFFRTVGAGDDSVPELAKRLLKLPERYQDQKILDQLTISKSEKGL
ncbi:hypothetical protein T4D_6341 [Trichinella pseudospiralis]|uniref:Uncharacterized protein n=1 Tax=Trichinella pseudospiralis TaxID=6337 RepID=A0A0V1F586_TRIPS|nr:hypothetical protein T4D_3774 [Trichinella pseudospiralis]KRY80961.1 hypothetical protein T4D_7698 [Trichinella pseudospiralis]KRY84473.1 hypothetical protein T4D_6341 [Trichinella pseudospiralis]